MFEFDAAGISALQRDINAAGDIPDGVLKEMVEAQAKVIEEALVYNAGTMLQGPYYEGEVARSPKHKKPRILKTGAATTITFEGMQHGNRNAEVAFVNEYGKKSQPARPFIQKSIRETLTPAAEAARKILNDHISSKNL